MFVPKGFFILEGLVALLICLILMGCFSRILILYFNNVHLSEEVLVATYQIQTIGIISRLKPKNLQDLMRTWQNENKQLLPYVESEIDTHSGSKTFFLKWFSNGPTFLQCENALVSDSYSCLALSEPL